MLAAWRSGFLTPSSDKLKRLLRIDSAEDLTPQQIELSRQLIRQRVPREEIRDILNQDDLQYLKTGQQDLIDFQALNVSGMGRAVIPPLGRDGRRVEISRDTPSSEVIMRSYVANARPDSAGPADSVVRELVADALASQGLTPGSVQEFVRLSRLLRRPVDVSALGLGDTEQEGVLERRRRDLGERIQRAAKVVATAVARNPQRVARVVGRPPARHARAVSIRPSQNDQRRLERDAARRQTSAQPVVVVESTSHVVTGPSTALPISYSVPAPASMDPSLAPPQVAAEIDLQEAVAASEEAALAVKSDAGQVVAQVTSDAVEQAGDAVIQEEYAGYDVQEPGTGYDVPQQYEEVAGEVAQDLVAQGMPPAEAEQRVADAAAKVSAAGPDAAVAKPAGITPWLLAAGGAAAALWASKG